MTPEKNQHSKSHRGAAEKNAKRLSDGDLLLKRIPSEFKVSGAKKAAQQAH